MLFRIMYNFWKNYVLFFGILESDNEEVWMQILVKVTAFFPRNIRQDNLLSQFISPIWGTDGDW